jgi:hypothetical protein
MPMSDQFRLTKAQRERIEPFPPRTRGIPRVDDRRSLFRIGIFDELIEVEPFQFVIGGAGQMDPGIR